MRCTAAAVVAVVCLAAAVSAATTVLEIADDAGSVQIGAALDTALTRRNPGVLGATNLQIDNLLNVTGQATFGTTGAGPVLVKNNLNVQGSTSLLGTTAVSGTTTLSGTTTVSGVTTFNAQTTFNNNPPQVNTDLYVNGILRHGQLSYHRARWYGMTAKIYAGLAQTFPPSAVTIVGFSCAAGQSGSGAANTDGWRFAAQLMWGGTDTSSAPTTGFSANNALVPPTDPATNQQMSGFFRLTASINVGGCTEQTDANTNSRSTTWRAIYFSIGPGPVTAPTSLKFYSGASVRELYPKEASLSISETVQLSAGQNVYLAFSNNCIAPNTISTIQPMAPPVTPGGSNPTQAMPGLHATMSMTYVGE